MRFKKLKTRLSGSQFLFLLPANSDVELLATSSASCLPASHCASCHNDNRLNPWTINQPQLNILLLRVVIVIILFTKVETLMKTVSNRPFYIDFDTGIDIDRTVITPQYAVESM